MKKVLLLAGVLSIALSVNAQQIGNGIAETITDINAPLLSGMYQLGSSSVEFPVTTNYMVHLLAIRHSNLANNHQLQLAADYAPNDRMFFRKITSNNLAPINPTWYELATRGTNTFTGSQLLSYGQSYWIGTSTNSGNRLRMHHSGNPGDAYIDFAPNLNFRAGTQSAVTFLQNGNVGIGTASPVSKLDVRGNVSLPVNQSLIIGNNDFYKQFRVTYMGDTNGGDTYMQFSNNLFFTNPNLKAEPFMVFSANGNVGIGALGPYYKLDVNGTIRAHEVKVETAWADYVFNEDYNLRSLSEVNDFIQENKHLPEIPTATEVETEGVNLGEMQTKLLQKVEELTLYLIQQQAIIDVLNAKVEKLENDKQ